MAQTCPRCGFDLRQKDWSPSRVSRVMRSLLEVLAERNTPVPRLEIAKAVVLKVDAADVHSVHQHRITSRLTDLRYLGLVSCEPGLWGVNVHGEVRYRTKPLWRITEDGKEFLRTGKLPAAPYDPSVGRPIPKESTVPDSLPG